MARILTFTVLFLVFWSALPAQPSFPISGKVIDSRSRPIRSATVTVLNSNRGTVTDENGVFLIRNLREGEYVLIASAVGFATLGKTVTVSNSTIDTIRFMLQDADNSLGNIVVTGQKKEEQLQQVPLSITALSSTQVKEYRLWNTKDITAVVPNLFSSNSGDERNVTSIRGIGTTSYDPAVATYIDGVNQFTLDTYSSQLMDVERIEVLRGPQGTLYGRNAMGGVINIITKKPTDVPEVFGELNIGNYGQQRYEAGFRVPLVKEKLYLGAAGMYSKRDGYYTNTFSGGSFDNQMIVAGNYYLKYRPTDKWLLSLNLRHQAHRNDGAYPLVFGTEEAFANPYQLMQDAKGRMVDNTLFSSLTASYAGSDFNFSSNTAYQSNYRYYKSPVDGDFSPIDAVTIVNNYGKPWNKVSTWTQDFKFSSPAASSSALQWTAGSYLFADDRPTKLATHYGKDAAMLGAPDIDFSTINTTSAKNMGVAFYGQLTYAITRRLNITGGLRYDYERKKYDVMGEYQKDGELPVVTTPDTSAAIHYSALSPKLGFSYTINNNHNLYISYSRGFRTGGMTQLSSDPSQPPLYQYDPEYSNNIELGLKNTFFGERLRANLAIFFTNITGVQVPTLVLPDAITIIRNAGRLNSKGAEIELSATPFKGLQASYSFGFTDASYSTLKLSQNGTAVDLDGKKQLYTPEVTSMLALQYAYDLGTRQHLKLIVRGEWAYVGKQYFDLANTISQSGYNLLNTRFGIASAHIDLMAWVRNLGSKKYIAYAYDFGAVHLGDPKTYGLTISIRR